MRGVRGAARCPAALLRELRGAARQRLQSLFALLRRDEQAGAPAVQLASPRNRSGSRAAAVGFFALLPIAVALGVVVGHSGSGNNDQAILEALRRQDAAAATTSAAANTTASVKKHAGATKKAAATSGRGHSKILANTPNGPIHQALGYEPTKHEAKADTELVKKNAKEVGKSYSKAEQNLPDVIVVGK